MLVQLKSIFKLMGQGLAHQDLGEMSPTADKIAQIEKAATTIACQEDKFESY